MDIPKLKWKRINVDKCFTDVVTDVEAVEKIENLKKINEFKINDYIWSFPKELRDFMKDSTKEEIYESDNGLLDRRFELKENEVLREDVKIVVPEGKTLKVFLDYHSKKKAHVYSLYQFEVKENATLDIVRIQRTSDDSVCFFETLVNVKEYGNVNIHDLQIGSKYKIVSTEVRLEDNVESNIIPIFIGDNDTFSDFSYTSHHIGRRSKSLIEGKGVLKGNAKKVFRGNLHFDEGSSRSVGREEERCLLFSENVISDSIPALMCDEDDVIGEHAASIGKFDESKLFYIMTRGFSENEARKIIVRSIFNSSLETVEDEVLREDIIKDIERRFSDL